VYDEPPMYTTPPSSPEYEAMSMAEQSWEEYAVILLILNISVLGAWDGADGASVGASVVEHIV